MRMASVLSAEWKNLACKETHPRREKLGHGKGCSPAEAAEANHDSEMIKDGAAEEGGGPVSRGLLPRTVRHGEVMGLRL